MTGTLVCNINPMTTGVVDPFSTTSEDDSSSEQAESTVATENDHHSPANQLSIAEKIERFQVSWQKEDGKDVVLLSDNNSVQEMKEKDIHAMRLLGRGAFSEVRQACLSCDPDQMFAIKRLSSSILADPKSLQVCATDFAMETAILSHLNHENIIHLHGVKQGNPAQLLKNGNFFIALDLLLDTLHDRLKVWKRYQKRQQKLSRVVDMNTVVKRLEDVGIGIVRGMEHLHENRIIYRDLKPLNVGFDEMYDNVKIFDFGFARVMSENKNRMMTGGIGTPRYMAPEIARHDVQYGLSADVYSFSIMLWQIITARTPFQEFSSASQLAAKVVMGNKRPRSRLIPSSALRRLLEEGWSPNPAERPTFSELRERLEIIIKDHKNGITNNNDGSSRETRCGGLTRRWSMGRSNSYDAGNSENLPNRRRSMEHLRRFSFSKSSSSTISQNESNAELAAPAKPSGQQSKVSPPLHPKACSRSPPRRRSTPTRHRRRKTPPPPKSPIRRHTPPPPDEILQQQQQQQQYPSTPTALVESDEIDLLHPIVSNSPIDSNDSVATMGSIESQSVCSLLPRRKSRDFTDSTDTMGSMAYLTDDSDELSTGPTKLASSTELPKTHATEGSPATFFQRTNWKNKRRNSMF